MQSFSQIEPSMFFTSAMCGAITNDFSRSSLFRIVDKMDSKSSASFVTDNFPLSLAFAYFHSFSLSEFLIASPYFCKNFKDNFVSPSLRKPRLACQQASILACLIEFFDVCFARCDRASKQMDRNDDTRSHTSTES